MHLFIFWPIMVHLNSNLVYEGHPCGYRLVDCGSIDARNVLLPATLFGEINILLLIIR